MNLTSIRVLYGKVTFANKFPSSLKIFNVKRNKIQVSFDNVYRAKTFFSLHWSMGQVLCRFWLSEHKIHLSKENKTLPKQISTLQPVGSPMQLVLTYWQPTFQAWFPTWPPRYVTFFGKTYTNDDLLSVRKLTDS